MAELLERANIEFYANNPDPLDTRHPVKVLPGCSLGFMLRHLHRSTHFFDKVCVFLIHIKRTATPSGYGVVLDVSYTGSSIYVQLYATLTCLKSFITGLTKAERSI